MKLKKILPASIGMVLLFIKKQKYIPNLINPKRFTEKLLYIKFHKTNYKLRCLITDRIKVRKYVQNISSEILFPEIYWHGYNISQKQWDTFPDFFVLKANHGSGNIRFIDKSKYTINSINEIIKKWSSQSYDEKGYEWYYDDLEKYSIVEQFISQNQNHLPCDFKFFCFNGKVKFVNVYFDRGEDLSVTCFDRNFLTYNHLLWNKTKNKTIPKPSNWDSIIKIVEKISTEFDFIRIDCYVENEILYFSELTNISGNACFEIEKKVDCLIGSFLDLKRG